MKSSPAPHTVLLLTALVVGAGCASTQRVPLPDDGPHNLVLRNVTIVDTHDGHLTPAQTVIVTAGKITQIGGDELQPPAPSTPIVDGHGKFLVPGFNDAHAHVLGDAEAETAQAMMLAHGITGVRQMSGSLELLAERKAGTLLRTHFAPQILTMPGDVLFPGTAFTPAEGIAQVDAQADAGADFIKIALTPPDTFFAVGAEAKKRGLPFLGHLPPGVDARDAARAGYRSIEHLGPTDAILIDCSTDEAAIKADIAAHPMPRPPSLPGFMTEGIMRKLVASPLATQSAMNPQLMTRLEHVIDTFDEDKCRKVLADLVAAGTWQVPTLIRDETIDLPDDARFMRDPNLRYVSEKTVAYWTELAQQFTKTVTPAQRATTHKLWALQQRFMKLVAAAGTPMMAGSDFGGQWEIAGISLHQELALLADAGLPPLQVLQMTTLNVATFLGREGTMGSVAVGRDADLVLLDANPIESAKALDQIQGVVRAGAYFPRDVLDARLAAIARDAPSRPAAPTHAD